MLLSNNNDFSDAKRIQLIKQEINGDYKFYYDNFEYERPTVERSSLIKSTRRTKNRIIERDNCSMLEEW